ncbi:DUF2510 domain-containing protein [Streptomyces sp. NPDC048172]|uniref:DUF2510 domain-containing protein n=1 Tax=Streptomyces sp. NPDC048172 TaxID=3365505 RepID=UPI0037221C4D
MTTPPGWYPDPGQTPGQPPQERWWDGGGWTEARRPAAGFPAAPAPAPAPAAPPPPPGRTGRGPLIAGLVGAVVLVVALAVGAVLLLDGGGEKGGSEDESKARPGSSESGKPSESSKPSEKEPGSTTPPGAPKVNPAIGVHLPKLKGWQRTKDAGGTSVTTRPYDCPGAKGKVCMRGSSVIMTSPGGTAVRRTAEADIGMHARVAYSRATYGGITGHQVIKKGKVTVAGKDGYRVRWKIDNKRQQDAYVESVAFKHPDGSGRTLLVRTSFDVHEEAPRPGEMDTLVDGVRKGHPDDYDTA